MNTQTRRIHVLQDIKRSETSLSATKLASKYHVSRQAIVGDVAILKAQGEKIVSTARGYIYATEHDGKEYVVACIHSEIDTEKELLIMIDQGAYIKDVIVEHPLYGEICGKLNLASRYDVEQFIKRSKQENAKMLSKMNDGIHLHTLVCSTLEQFRRIEEELQLHGFLYQ